MTILGAIGSEVPAHSVLPPRIERPEPVRETPEPVRAPAPEAQPVLIAAPLSVAGPEPLLARINDDAFSGESTSTSSSPVRVPSPPEAAPRAPKAAPKANGKPKPVKEEKQEQMLFEPVTRGRFEKSEPTIVDGQDLDVPAFMRMNIRIK